MGQHASTSASPPPPENTSGTIDREPKPACQRHHIFPQSFKRLLTRCRGSKEKLLKNDMKSFHHHHENLTPSNTNVILTTTHTVPDPLSRLFIAFPTSSSPPSNSKIFKHSLVSLALSKLAFFAQASKERMTDDNKVTESTNQKLYFHKTTTKKKAKTKSKPPENASSSSKTEANPDANNNKEKRSVNLLELSKYDSKLRAELIRKLLSPANTNSPQTPEEMYKRNLKSFERLLTITTASSQDDDDSMSEGAEAINNRGSKIGVHLPRIISSSKNRVEVDVNFMDWISSKISSKKDSNGNSKADTKKPSIAKQNASGTKRLRSTATTRGTTTKQSLTVPSEQKTRQSKATSARTDKSSSWSKSTATKSYYSVAVGQTLVEDDGSEEESSSPDENNNMKAGKGYYAKDRSERHAYRESRNSMDRSFVKRGCCAGKGIRGGAGGGAPPAYLDYGGMGGGGGSGAGARRRAQQDPVMERLKNVDVVEELTYLVPNPGGCGDESDEEDCEYYAVCDSCGEMEPLPEELKKQISNKKGKKEDTTPVTYSRRQRFNFNQKNGEDDEDGPPFRYEGLQCSSCRCNCCVAGLRRNPNCQCKCCQAMGTLRRCNSFDETPVGKNPQIRRIQCPEEICKQKIEKCVKEVPETSGMYKFDKKEKGFVLHVPRTPTPIILEVPAPRRLQEHELQRMARGMANKKFGAVQRPPTPVEAEAIVLPPIYGQCNPCCNPCCGPNQQNPKAKTVTTANGSGYNSGYTYNSNAPQQSYTYSKGTDQTDGSATDTKSGSGDKSPSSPSWKN